MFAESIFFENASERITQFLLNLLAVAGGFAAGYALLWIFGFCFDRFVLKDNKKSPEFLHKVLQNVGGLIGAVIVALIVFGGGSGTGPGNGTGTSTTNTENPTNDSQPPATLPVTPPPPPPDLDQEKTYEIIKVTILAGEDVAPGTVLFYHSDNRPPAIDLDTLAGQILELRKKAKKPLAVVYTFGFGAGEDTPATSNLKSWGQQNGIVVLPPDQVK